MLLLKRRAGESLILDGKIKITVVGKQRRRREACH